MDLSYLQNPFNILGDYSNAKPYGSGHINDTYAAVYQQAGTDIRYIHQRINQHVFQDIPKLMENIFRVTEFSQKKLAEEGILDRSRRSLVLLKSQDGLPYYLDEEGHYWRTYLFVEHAATYDRAESPCQAREAARAFGKFQSLLNDLPGERLHETIPLFHHTRSRFDRFILALERDSLNRAANARSEINWFMEREHLVDVVLDAMERGEIPERITHNDTKLNNVMLDDKTMEGICVIDLDTVMPGSALYDFGDLVRTATNSGNEDQKNTSGIHMNLEMFEAIVDGYLGSAGSFLKDREVEMLSFAGRLITYEIGMRFLTDYLEGDPYFKTHREEHNLDRCRSQMALVKSIEAQQNAMEKIVKERYSSCVSL